MDDQNQQPQVPGAVVPPVSPNAGQGMPVGDVGGAVPVTEPQPVVVPSTPVPSTPPVGGPVMPGQGEPVLPVQVPPSVSNQGGIPVSEPVVPVQSPVQPEVGQQ